ncbi:uncharacterized protein Z518_03358 [Rhinocladiella mackenziei CBS 650.93]|uniref:Major facilitator superfamily (MFS) profile domain-containing protein n=1 Tax=Rhinocladiella mackenziei CBS 650.93 TaxID=1442369 RepID=A0A0D2IZ66_9EURO|nr:uncharacterized protein Z518_03358 [Rhinocladiella mackenziei CBS 650.93]KIX08701.1 hypothetical protein Z518_03358 [Rhinocladiella mackenziei CBS 650.93]
MAGNRYTLGIALFASLGTFLYGYDTGIVTTTIAHQSWINYMNHPDPGLVCAVGAIYIAGEAVGAILQIIIADQLGRIGFMELLCVIVTIGCVIQTAAVNIAELLDGKLTIYFSIGALCATVPIYLSEISSSKSRGLIGGLSGVGLSCGITVSNWVGYACNYAPYGSLQWRLPLGFRIPWGVIMFIGLKDKVEEARKAFVGIRSDLHSHEVPQEFGLMKSQIEFEMKRHLPSFSEAFKLYRHRVLASIAVQVLTATTGVNVIQDQPFDTLICGGDGTPDDICSSSTTLAYPKATYAIQLPANRDAASSMSWGAYSTRCLPSATTESTVSSTVAIDSGNTSPGLECSWNHNTVVEKGLGIDLGIPLLLALLALAWSVRRERKVRRLLSARSSVENIRPAGNTGGIDSKRTMAEMSNERKELLPAELPD